MRSEGTRAEMAYCRRNFLNRTALLTIQVFPPGHQSNTNNIRELDRLF